MAKNTMDTFKNVGAGLAAGIMLGVAGSMVMKESRNNKRRSTKAINAVENVLDSIQEIFR